MYMRKTILISLTPSELNAVIVVNKVNIINKTTTKSTVNKDNSKKKTTKNKVNSKQRQQ